jgi:hypothetical protein
MQALLFVNNIQQGIAGVEGANLTAFNHRVRTAFSRYCDVPLFPAKVLSQLWKQLAWHACSIAALEGIGCLRRTNYSGRLHDTVNAGRFPSVDDKQGLVARVFK